MITRTAEKRTRQGGIVLVIVLWATTLLGILVGSMLLTTRANVQLTQIQGASTQAHALAEAGVYRAIFTLLTLDRKEAWRTNDILRGFRFGNGTVRTSVQDEAGKIDLNKADRELFDDLLRSLGRSDEEREQLIDAWLDWRDTDDSPLPHGAEGSDYRALALGYGPKNGPFDTVEDLQQVIGMTPDLFKRLRPAVTVHSRRSNVNLAVAPREVLAAVPKLDHHQLDSLLANRDGELPRDALSTLDTRYSSTSRGTVFTIRSEGEIANTRARIKAIVAISRRSQRPYTILSWQGGGLGQF